MEHEHLGSFSTVEPMALFLICFISIKSMKSSPRPQNFLFMRLTFVEASMLKCLGINMAKYGSLIFDQNLKYFLRTLSISNHVSV